MRVLAPSPRVSGPCPDSFASRGGGRASSPSPRPLSVARMFNQTHLKEGTGGGSILASVLLGHSLDHLCTFGAPLYQPSTNKDPPPFTLPRHRNSSPSALKTWVSPWESKGVDSLPRSSVLGNSDGSPSNHGNLPPPETPVAGPQTSRLGRGQGERGTHLPQELS